MAGLEGTHLDQYYLLELLGQGGMSEVYLAQDTTSGQEVAVKVVSGNNAIYLERFRREAEAIDKLHHPHILPALDYGDQEPWHYLVMPLVEYGTLRDRLEEDSLSLEETGELLRQIASALQFAHDRGVIHRDIKPSNILMRDRSYTYLADFGLVKTLEGMSELTLSGTLLGTPEYMAPDLADGPATTSTDIYAMGIMLYQMVTGELPFTGDTPVAVYWKHLRERPVPPSQINPNIPLAIDQVIMHALEKDPRRRFQSVRELEEAYQEALLHPHILPQFAAQTNAAAQEVLLLRANGTTSRSRRFINRARSWTQLRRPVHANNPVIAPAAVRERHTPPIMASLPIRMRRRQRIPSEPGFMVGEEVIRPRRNRLSPKRIKKLNRLTTTIIVAGLLSFVIMPMVYMAYMYNNARPELMAQATATAIVQNNATATASVLTNAINGTSLLNDSLATNTGKRWTEDSSGCIFTGGSYHISVNQSNAQQSCALQSMPNVANVTVQVDVALLNGSSAGIILRANGDRYYDFQITRQGEFFFRRHDGKSVVNLLPPQPGNALQPVFQANTLLVIANGTNFKLFINKTFVGSVQDNTYDSGKIALITSTGSDTSAGMGSFTNFKLFKVN